MRYVTAIALSVLLGLCALAAPALAEKPATVSVQGQATLRRAPDQAVLTVGVLTRADTAAQAAEANARDMNQVRAALKAKLGPQDTLQSAGYWLRPRTVWNKETQQNEVKGYEASHRVSLTTRDPKALGGLLDAAVKAGANKIDGPSWQLSDPSALQREALAVAFGQAKAKALALAKAAGMKLGPVLKISTGRESSPAPLATFRMAKAASNTSLEPGLVAVSASVSCVFALIP